MNNELEEFLRQSAAIRQRKAIEQRSENERQRELESRSRPRPYTNSRLERQVDSTFVDDDDEDETVVGVEIINEGPSRDSKRGTTREPSVHENHGQTPKANTAEELRTMLSKPNGVRQAFLIREILNRPRF